MSERNIKGTWKAKERKVSKTFFPMIGIVYKALYKDKEVIGVLEQVGGIEAFIRTKENKLLSVDKNSLKIVVPE